MSTSAPPPPQQSLPPKKKTSTLTIVLAILGGGFLLVMIAVAIGIYVVATSPTGKAMIGVMGEAVRISAKAQKAPGTNELRAMGCKQAMVMDIDDLAKMMAPLDASMPSRDQSPFGEMVICQVGPFKDAPPSCESVASTYVTAVGTRPKAFAATVQQSGSAKAKCSVLYDEQGAKIRNLDEQAAPPPIE